jgi:hypothetical protein
MPSRSRRGEVDRELTLEEMLMDPITQAMMRADGVSASHVLAIVSRLREYGKTAPSFRQRDIGAAASLMSLHRDRGRVEAPPVYDTKCLP